MAAALPPQTPIKLSATGRAVLHDRRPPGQVVAGAFAVIVHVGFFALIVFGVSWQVKAPTPLTAELWSAIPQAIEKPIQPAPPPEPTPPPEPKVEPKIEPKVEPKVEPRTSQPTKADIALKAKKEREEKLKREKAEKDAADLKKREEQKRIDDKKKADDARQRKAEEAKQKAEADRLRAEADAKAAAAQAARDKAVSDYTGRIAALIRNRANIPDNVTGQPVIQLRVRLLTNGTVFEATVANPSGNRAYDEAVERAINGIRQWPVPDNPEILGRQRELLLNIKHER